MPPVKFSLTRPGSDEPDETFEIDEELADRVTAVVDADPDLTMAEVVRQGLRRIADDPPVPPNR